MFWKGSSAGGIWQLTSPHPREFAIQGKKMPMPGGQTRGGGGGGGEGGLGAGGIDWCIKYTSQLNVKLAFLFLPNNRTTEHVFTLRS